MLTNKNIKIFVLSLVGLLVASFILLKKTAPTNKTEVATSTEQPQFSVVPQTQKLIATHSPVLGPQDAPVTIVEFLDPECEACSAMYPIVKKIMKEHEGKIKLVVRYMPFHGNSVFAANVLESAHEQGKYWKTLELMFDQQATWASHHDPKPELIYSIIKPVGLDMEKVKNDVKNNQYKALIEQDKLDGEALGVNRTPTFFVNGEQLYEMGYQPLKDLVLKKLN